MAMGLFIETYGCQMNLNDTQIVQSIMTEAGFSLANTIEDADVVLLNTCSVRQNAEERIHNRIEILFHQLKKRKTKTILGIIGCMAARLQDSLLNSNSVVGLVVGPDEYRQLPQIVNDVFEGQRSVAPNLHTSEMYDDITPLRTEGFSAWLSIMRGCNNFCSYCIVPYTRGRERSRPINTILTEINQLAADGFKEVTLLGQNVNSYSYDDVLFPQLLARVAEAVPDLRIRFLTSHPRNLSEDLVKIMAEYKNICKSIHLAMQSGSTRILERMNRKYTADHYLNLVELIRRYIPYCAITTDIIAGYPSETIEDHKATLDMMQRIQFDAAFMFRYSPREGTKSFSQEDDVSEEEKIHRLNEIIELQNSISLSKNQATIGSVQEVLVERTSKRNANQWVGKADSAKQVIFNNTDCIYKEGNLVDVLIDRATSATLFGEVVLA